VSIIQCTERAYLSTKSDTINWSDQRGVTAIQLNVLTPAPGQEVVEIPVNLVVTLALFALARLKLQFFQTVEAVEVRSPIQLRAVVMQFAKLVSMKENLRAVTWRILSVRRSRQEQESVATAFRLKYSGQRNPPVQTQRQFELETGAPDDRSVHEQMNPHRHQSTHAGMQAEMNTEDLHKK
jgi:hypothetical protein